MNDQATMTEKSARREYDLEPRTGLFGEAIIAFARKIPLNEITRPLVSQLVRAATSIGANYVEADDADSKKDFRFKIGLSRRETREAKPWLRRVVAAEPQLRDEAKPPWREAQELNLIFGAIR